MQEYQDTQERRQDKIKASLEDGVLMVRVPKAIEHKPERKKIALT